MSCPHCKKTSLVQIDLTIADRAVTMRSCSGCDVRWWQAAGEAMHLPGVLELASRR